VKGITSHLVRSKKHCSANGLLQQNAKVRMPMQRGQLTALSAITMIGHCGGGLDIFLSVP
jgi:hypothetical protein